MGKWLGIADETQFGTPVTPPTVFLDCAAIDLHPERESAEIVSSNIVGPQAVGVGTYKILGEIEINPNSGTIMKLLKYLMGVPVTVNDGSNHYRHTFTPTDALKFGTMYKVDDTQPDGTNALQYISCIATECRLEAAINAFLSTRFSILGQKDAKVAKPTLGTMSVVKQFFSMDGKMYWDLTGSVEETNIRAVSLTFTREVPDDFYSMNDAFLKGFIPGNAKLEGSVDLIWKDWIGYQKFWGGATGPTVSPAYVAMMLDFIGPALGGAGEYLYHRMKWKLPALLITSVEEPIAGRDAIIQTLNFKAARGVIDATQTVVQVVLYNEIATA